MSKLVELEKFEEIYSSSCPAFGGCNNDICKDNPCEVVAILRSIAYNQSDKAKETSDKTKTN